MLILAGGDEIARIPFKSNGEKRTTHMRGALGAALSAFEFIDANFSESDKAKVFSKDEYVWKWLPQNISAWIAEAKRPNRDLLLKLAPMIEKHLAVSFHSAAEASEADMNLAADAAKEAKLGTVSAYDIEEEQDVEEQATEFLRLRAMSRDPWN
ncbi:hypothetical protein X736_04705 [Mesorhizobium sp. L2C089B000]|nr:hypothetical protein X736_04705 [Mesorhizobium sp. L2C089B000]